MDWVTVIKDCGLQVIVVVVLVVQFFVTVYLRRRLRALERYESWYLNQYQQYQSSIQPLMMRYPLSRPK